MAPLASLGKFFLDFGKRVDCLPSSLYIAEVLPVRTSLLIWTVQEQHTRDVIRHALLSSAPAQDERLPSARGQVQQCK